MSNDLRFEGRVAIVTGAGNGLGRSHALEYGRRGARVVVNDLGGATSGGGVDASVAQGVVDEIRAAGGEAVVNGDSVEDGGRIVQCALDTYGQIDIVVNNAGILRDAAYHKMSDDDWSLVRRVHLDGAHAVTRAAWPHMRSAGYGRIVMTTSGAGVYGNFGQANYSAAKLGLFGMAQTLAHEGRTKGVYVNTIAPVAASRLTEGVMTPEMLKALQPELVTPLVMLLTHESCGETGQLFEVGGGWVSRLRWEQSKGVLFDPQTGFSAEQLKERWAEVSSFEGAAHPVDVMHSLQIIGGNIGVDLGLQKQ